MSREEVVSIRGWLEHHHNPKNDERLAQLRAVERHYGPDDGPLYSLAQLDEEVPVEGTDEDFARHVEEELGRTFGG